MERTCAILIRTNLTVWSGQPYRYRGLAVPFKRNMQTACAVVYSESELSWCREVYPNFSDEALNKFLDAANGDVSKVISSSSIYNEQKTHIKYPESWIIACIKDGYYEKRTNKPTKKINHGFKERDYDWDELESELFNQNL